MRFPEAVLLRPLPNRGTGRHRMMQDDHTGMRFGSFEVLSRPDGSVHELGRGGFGRTLLARHSILDTEVALKLIDERFAQDDVTRGRFLKEAKEQARLNHPGIARITDCGQVDGQLYYAVELCPGGHLKEYVMRCGALSVTDTLHLLRQAAEALEYAHRRGVVHLDVKPSNLMLVFDEDGRPQVKLIDFGLVQRTAADQQNAGRDGATPMFSPAFASPEQIRGQATDGRSDLFSLGLTGWYLLSGRNPVEGAADAVIRERLTTDEYEARLPASITGKPRQILARMVRKNAGARYASAAELLYDLTDCLQNMPRLSGGWPERTKSSGALGDRFMLEKGVASRLGTVHQGLEKESRQRVRLTVLRPGTPAQVITQYQKAADALRGAEGAGLVRVLEVAEFTEGWTVVEEAVAGTPLTDILRSEGALRMGRCAPLLWQIGSAADTAFASGILSLSIDDAIVELGSNTRPVDWWLAQVKIPLSTGAAGQIDTRDADVTRTGGDFTQAASTGGGVQMIARWIYFIVGGLQPPPAALYAIKEYIAIPGLGDSANQMLARHLAGLASPPRCEDLLRQLFAAEGLSWDSTGERVKNARWAGVTQQADAVIAEIEKCSGAAEQIAEQCSGLTDAPADVVDRCYDAVRAVYGAVSTARTQMQKLSAGQRTSLAAGRETVEALEESLSKALAALHQAETAQKEAAKFAAQSRQEKEERERKRRALIESLAEACRRTEAAAAGARATAEECRESAPGTPAARQTESLASQTGALAVQLGTLLDEANAANDADLAKMENRIAQARNAAKDAEEIARTCRTLLDKAKADARRRADEQERQKKELQALLQDIALAESEAGPAEAVMQEMAALAAAHAVAIPAAEKADTDAARINAVLEDLGTLRALDGKDAAKISAARQQVATAADDLRGLVRSLRATVRSAQEAVAAHKRAEEAERARIAAEEAERRHQEEEKRRQAEAAERARIAAIEDQRRREEEAARLAAQEAENATQRAAEEARRKLEEEQRRAAAEAERQRLAEEAARRAEADAAERVRQQQIAAEKALRDKEEAEARAKAAAEKAQRDKEAAEAKAAAAAAEKARREQEAAKAKAAAQAEREAKEKAEAERKAATAAEKAKRDEEAKAAKAAAIAEREAKQRAEAEQKAAAAAEKARRAEAGIKAKPETATEPAGTKKSKTPLFAAAAVLALAGGGAAWWFSQKEPPQIADNNPPREDPKPSQDTVPPVPPKKEDPPPPPPLETRNIRILLSGEAITTKLISPDDITITGSGLPGAAREGLVLQYKLNAADAPLPVTLASTKKGIRLEPSTLSLPRDKDAELTVAVTREMMPVTFKSPPAARPSFYTRAILTWQPDAAYALPGPGSTISLNIAQAAPPVPSGKWSVAFDDDVEAPDMPGASGVIVDRRDAGTLSGNIETPPGLPNILYGVLDWSPPIVEADIKGWEELWLADFKTYPALVPHRNVLDPLARKIARDMVTMTLPVPCLLTRNGDRLILMNPAGSGVSEVLTNVARDLWTAGCAMALDKMEAEIASITPEMLPGAERTHWSAVLKAMTAAAALDAKSGNAAERRKRAAANLEQLKAITTSVWAANAEVPAAFASQWAAKASAVKDARVFPDGHIEFTAGVATEPGKVSGRKISLSLAEDGSAQINIAAGPAAAEKDTFEGRLSPAAALPDALQEKLPK